jgi:hypothetical protein
MKNQLLIFCFALLSANAFSQTTLITCRTQTNSDQSVIIYADNKSDADYTVKLYLSLTGYTSTLSPNPGLVRVPGKGSTQIAKITPDKTGALASWSYRYQYYPGVSFRKTPDTSITYLLPGTAGNMLVASGVTNMQQLMGQKVTDNNISTGFMYQLGDTICAARAGTVYESYSGATEGEKFDQTFNRSARNQLHVQHKDGSISHYSILAPIKLLVSDGEHVVPGQPLAVFNKEAEKYTMLYSVYYIEEKKLMKEIEDPTKPDFWGYLQPAFLVGGTTTREIAPGKTYTVEFNNEVIARELSKKEKKNLGLQ